jgi:hypothetical protein
MDKKTKKQEKDTISFIRDKKKEMKESQYRVKFDALSREIQNNLVDTAVSYGAKKYESSGWGSRYFSNNMFYNSNFNGKHTFLQNQFF